MSEDHTLEQLESTIGKFEPLLKNSYKNPSWEPEQVAENIPVKDVQSNNRPRLRDEKQICPIFQNLRYEPTFHKYGREE